MPRRRLALLLSALAAACAAPGEPAPPPIEPAFAGRRPTMAEAAEHFDRAGVQPGQPLPALSLVDQDGGPVDLTSLRAGRPLVLVTCSLTCNIARRQAKDAAALQHRLGDGVLVALVYTIDAHPAGEPCPYTGEEWVPPANAQDGVLVPQPRRLAERLALARRYAAEWAHGLPVFVDTMDDRSWRALGGAPHLGLAVAADGTVLARTGWFEPKALAAALEGRP
ncbi:MAG: hypothetical protein KF830_07300 [Planctomycetes bacterium]|nr:hypothetical protein [Planctomycetota bacterium]